MVVRGYVCNMEQGTPECKSAELSPGPPGETRSRGAPVVPGRLPAWACPMRAETSGRRFGSARVFIEQGNGRARGLADRSWERRLAWQSFASRRERAFVRFAESAPAPDARGADSRRSGTADGLPRAGLRFPAFAVSNSITEGGPEGREPNECLFLLCAGVRSVPPVILGLPNSRNHAIGYHNYG